MLRILLVNYTRIYTYTFVLMYVFTYLYLLVRVYHSNFQKSCTIEISFSSTYICCMYVVCIYIFMYVCTHFI